MTNYKVGDFVRITAEGVISEITQYSIALDDKIWVDRKQEVVVEVISPPVPAKIGTLIRLKSDHSVLYVKFDSKRWRGSKNGFVAKDDDLTLAPNGSWKDYWEVVYEPKD